MIGEKLQKLLDQNGIKPATLARRIGVSKSTIYSIIKRNNKSIELSLMERICDELDVPVEYFYDRDEQTEDRENAKIAPFLSDEAMQIAIDYSLLDSYGKRTVRVILKDQQKRMMEEEAAAPHRDNVIPLPKSIQKTSAGRGAYLGPEEMETIMVEENDLTRRASFCVPVSGDSMEPIYHDGDILLVEGREDIEPGQIGVFTVDGDGYVKKRGEGELISLNPDYAPIPLTENSWCNGLVIGVLDKAWIRE